MTNHIKMAAKHRDAAISNLKMPHSHLEYLLIHFVLKVNWIRFGNVGEVQPNRFNKRICRYLSSYQLSTFAVDSLTFDLTPRSTICLGGLTVKAYWKARTIHGQPQPVNSIV